MGEAGGLQRAVQRAAIDPVIHADRAADQAEAQELAADAFAPEPELVEVSLEQSPDTDIEPQLKAAQPLEMTPISIVAAPPPDADVAPVEAEEAVPQETPEFAEDAADSRTEYAPDSEDVEEVLAEAGIDENPAAGGEEAESLS